MKKILSLILSIAIILSIGVSCFAAKEKTDDSLQKVLESGKLVVAIESSWAPFCFMEEDEVLRGLLTEYFEVICDELGVEPDWFTSSSYDALLSAVDSGRADVLYSFTIGQSDKFITTSPFTETVRALTVAADSDISCWEDIEGKLCANALGGSNALVAMQFGAEITKATIDEAMLLITQGRADCQVENVVSLQYFLDAKPEIAEKVKQVDYYSDPETAFSSPAFRPDQIALRDRIDEIVQAKVADGTFYDILVKWAGKDAADSCSLYKDITK